MKKYVFKDRKVEEALRLVAESLGIDDDEFDEEIQRSGNRPRIFFMDGGHNLLTFSTRLLKEAEEFKPDGWNDCDVVPDQCDGGISDDMLVEDCYHRPYRAYFDFYSEKWIDLATHEVIDCYRYRSYPFE